MEISFMCCGDHSRQLMTRPSSTMLRAESEYKTIFSCLKRFSSIHNQTFVLPCELSPTVCRRLRRTAVDSLQMGYRQSYGPTECDDSLTFAGHSSLNFSHESELQVSLPHIVQWNLVIKRSDITKPSYNKVILLVPALYISLFFYPDIMRNLI